VTLPPGVADLIQAGVCGVPLRLVLIDGGYRPGGVDELPLNRVYDFVRQFPRLVRVTKGSSTAMRTPLVASHIEVTRKGTASKAGLKLLRLDTDFFKSWLFERIRRPHDQPGAWHLPHDVSEDYCRQVVSEARVRLASGRVKWVRRSRQNHFLDCESMNAAGAHLLNVARIGASAPRPAQPPPDHLDDLPRPGGPAIRDDVDPNEVHQAFAEARRLQGLRPSGWVHDGGRLRGNWFNPRG